MFIGVTIYLFQRERREQRSNASNLYAVTVPDAKSAKEKEALGDMQPTDKKVWMVSHDFKGLNYLILC